MNFSKALVSKYLNHKIFIQLFDEENIGKYSFHYLATKYVKRYQEQYNMTFDEAFFYCLEQGIVEQGVIDDINEFMIGSL